MWIKILIFFDRKSFEYGLVNVCIGDMDMFLEVEDFSLDFLFEISN